MLTSETQSPGRGLCVCVAGAPHVDLDAIEQVLRTAGLAAPKRAAGAGGLDLQRWHSQVLSQRALQASPHGSEGGPGVPWERLATDIWLANLGSPAWVWSHSDATWLLDFWADFDHEMHFVLPCVSAADFLARALQAPEAGADAGELLTTWRHYHETLLRFHHRHRARSVLFLDSDWRGNADGLIDELGRRWQLSLRRPGPVAASHGSPLAAYLAHTAVARYGEIAELEDEIAATALQLGAPRSGPAARQPDLLASALAHFQEEQRSLARERAEDAARLRAAEASCQQAQQRAAAAERETQLRISRSTALERQLAQVQAQLSTRDRELGALSEQLAASAAAADEARQLATALSERREQDFAQCHAGVVDLLDSLKASLNESETHFRRGQALTAALARAETELAELATRAPSNELRASLAQSQARVEILDQVCRAAEDRVAALQAASAEHHGYLLQEIEDLQAESATHFRQLLAAQAGVHAAQQRWERASGQFPALYDAAHVTAEHLGGGRIRWRFVDAQFGAQHYPELNVVTSMEDGMLGLQFRQGDGLRLWPVASGREQVLILPVFGGTDQAERLMTLLCLGTSDWQLLRRLATLFSSLRASAGPEALAVAADQLPALERAAGRLRAFVEQFPAVIRVDGIRLEATQQQHEYEALTLVLEQFMYGTTVYPRFPIRLACAAIDSQGFGSHPRLEFPPLADGHPLASWFAESVDAHGPKFELRFALPDAVDLGVWSRLCQTDQALMLALAAALPDWLRRLEADGARATRPWAAWHPVVAMIAAIATTALGVTAEQQPTKNLPLLVTSEL
ncbi:hypothetical protein [Pseudoduganella namucuonensis]|uniref:Uncharacterized protein n=1 Tax=Pseudoduganella namucuonensis TaxID=1035707 RepID=A0A1I7M546_9BURK|nr:hypothetical protein [Pseudoduganella namucuonensis]SFV17074.1 hypothetical protein SAMN05216552_10595 [Pseudoduganella namucuonensis]